MKNKGKFIALLLVVAIIFGLWNGPIKSYANKKQVESASEDLEQESSSEEIIIPEDKVVDSFTIDMEDNSYMEYKITDTFIYCIYHEYVKEDENGNVIYNDKITATPIAYSYDNEYIEDEEVEENKEVITRGGGSQVNEGNPLYWQKNVTEKLKKEFFYQRGVKGEDIYYRIGGEHSVAVNYTKLSETNAADIDAFVEQIDLVNKELAKCIAYAVGAIVGTIMIAISTIIASYVSVGAAKCLNLVASILKKFGISLLQITPVAYGKMVFNTYEEYKLLDPLFVKAATHGSIFTQ